MGEGELTLGLAPSLSAFGSVSLWAIMNLLTKEKDTQSASSSPGHPPNYKQLHLDHLLGRRWTPGRRPVWTLVTLLFSPFSLTVLRITVKMLGMQPPEIRRNWPEHPGFCPCPPRIGYHAPFSPTMSRGSWGRKCRLE